VSENSKNRSLRGVNDLEGRGGDNLEGENRR